MLEKWLLLEQLAWLRSVEKTSNQVPSMGKVSTRAEHRLHRGSNYNFQLEQGKLIPQQQ